VSFSFVAPRRERKSACRSEQTQYGQFKRPVVRGKLWIAPGKFPKLDYMPDAITDMLAQLLTTSELAELGPTKRTSSRPLSALEASLDEVIRDTKLPSVSQQLVRALILLWHDHLDASHTISQGIENPDGSLVHAIMHRREPDYWNSKYWWRRVGKHPCFPELARRVTEVLKKEGEQDLVAKLVPHGNWDAFAFVDACEAAAGLPASDKRVRLLREIQRIESEVALDHFLGTEAR